LPDTDSARFRSQWQELGISPVFIHIPYLINLASPYERLYKKSIQAYIEDIREAGRLGAEYIVTHMGSHKKKGEDAGLARFTQALNIILGEVDSAVTVLLENTAGSGSWLGGSFLHHARIIEGLKKPERVGVCLDTCHAFVAGYDIRTPEGLEATLHEIDTYVRLDRLKLIHLNDAQDPLGSHRDRHAHIGEGEIGIEGFRYMLNHPALKRLSFILETPKKNPGDDQRNLKVVRGLLS
jgi:deoxyribonuclease-4